MLIIVTVVILLLLLLLVVDLINVVVRIYQPNAQLVGWALFR